MQGCTDTATFVTATNIGIAASVNTEQVNIGYGRTELFQGPNYPDVGDAPPVVGFLGSDLQVFSPKIRQLYATGDAAGLVTMPEEPKPCIATTSAASTQSPDLCAEQPATLSGERRPLIFGTGTNVGLKLGFTGNYPSNIKFGFDREELSIIPLHHQAASTEQPDKYTSVLAAIDMNLDTPTLTDTGLQITQFFATGAAAKNLAKHPDIRAYFQKAAVAQIDQGKVAQARKILGDDQVDIKAYFDANTGQNFTATRDRLLKAPELSSDYPLMPANLKNAGDYTSFNAALQKRGDLIKPIASEARRLDASPPAAAQPKP